MNYPERYRRQLQLPGFGEDGQQKLTAASVLVVGAGGLGIPVLQYLTGMGVGVIGVVDADVVNLTNLHRQIIYSPVDVGKLKVDCCVPRLQKQNPEVQVKGFPVFLTPENALSILGEFDVVVDATDNFNARYLINDACVILKKPFVYGAIQYYEGHVSVFNYQGGPTYRCLYPTPPSQDQIPDCNTAGVLGIIPGLVGCQQALEVIKVITGIGKPLSGTLQIYDFLYNSQYSIQLSAKEENKKIKSLQENAAPVSCSSEQIISAQKLLNWFDQNKTFNLLDVREPHEFGHMHLKNAYSIPLSQLIHGLPDLPKDLPWVVLCQRGGRSRKAIQYIQEVEPKIQLHNLEGGLSEWIKSVGNHHLITA
ncbi:MAG: HesA/MoeB/ThiF family protein [Anditalea sp.]